MAFREFDSYWIFIQRSRDWPRCILYSRLRRLKVAKTIGVPICKFKLQFLACESVQPWKSYFYFKKSCEPVLLNGIAKAAISFRVYCLTAWKSHMHVKVCVTVPFFERHILTYCNSTYILYSTTVRYLKCGGGGGYVHASNWFWYRWPIIQIFVEKQS